MFVNVVCKELSFFFLLSVLLQVPSHLQAEVKNTTDLPRCKRLLDQQPGLLPSQMWSNILNCSTVKFCQC